LAEVGEVGQIDRWAGVVRRTTRARWRVGRPRSARGAFHNIYGPGTEKKWFFDPSTSGGGVLMDLGVHLVDLGLWLFEPSRVELEVVELSESRPVEDSAQLALRLDDVPMVIDVSWSAPLPSTEISFQVETDDGPIRWENVNGSFFHFHTLHNGAVVLDRETTLRYARST
jgi:predicted dehydrogenase